MEEKQKDKAKKFERSLFRKILNGIIALFAILIVIILVFFGFSQTKSFRTYLRSQIIDNVNQSINGELEIGKIDGSVLTSLILRNVNLTNDADTIFQAERIEIKSSPLHLLLRKIYIRKFEIKNAKVSLLQHQNGYWNYELLGDTSQADTTVSPEKKEKDSTFPFGIQINKLDLKNISFIRRAKEYPSSEVLYDHVNIDNLNIDHIYLSAKLKADLKKQFADLDLFNLSGYPNFRIFHLKELSGKFSFTKKFTKINDFKLVTDSSNVKLDAKLNGFNLFGNLDLAKFNNYPLDISLNAKRFYFDDLSTFIDATKILKGTVAVDFKAKGKFGNFDVKKLSVDYLNTHLLLSGNVKNLHKPGKLFFDVRIKDSQILQDDVLKLLPEFSLPEFYGLELNGLNMTFKGEPTRFHSVLESNVGTGSIDLDAYMDLQAKEPEYDVEFRTNQLNLLPVVGTTTDLTGSGKIKGKSFTPTKMASKIELQLFGSHYNGYNIDTLNFYTTANAKVLDLNLESLVNNAEVNVKGELDLRDKQNPVYNLTGNTLNLNLATFTKDSLDASNLNFTFSAKGKSLDIDSMNAAFVVRLDSSEYRGKNIDDTDISLKLVHNASGRKIELNSDLIDFHIAGDFSLEKSIELLAYESDAISEIIKSKLKELNPAKFIVRKQTADTLYHISPIANENINFDFNFEFKDLELLALFTNLEKLDIEGKGSGSVKNTSNNFSVSSNFYLDYFLNKNNGNVIYFSDAGIKFHFSRDNQTLKFDKLFGSLSIEGKHIYAGADLKNATIDLIFNQSKLFYSLAAEAQEEIYAEAEGELLMEPDVQRISVENLWVNYKNTDWENEETFYITIADSFVSLDNIVLVNDNASFSIDGRMNNDGTQNLSVKLQRLPGRVFSKYIFEHDYQYFDSDINLLAEISGTPSEPLIDLKYNMKDITYQNINFGSLIANLNYHNKLLNLNTSFVDSTGNFESPLFLMQGYVPVDLRFTKVENRFPDSTEMNIQINSENFKLAPFENLIPQIKKLKGEFLADVSIRGTFDEPQFSGSAKLKNCNFTVKSTNLNYGLNSEFNFHDEAVDLTNFMLKNTGFSKKSGRLKGNGEITFDGFKVDEINISADGNLALLSNYSKGANPVLYGDLFVETENPLKYLYKNNKSFISGKINIVDADIVYLSGQVSQNYSDRKIVYNFVADTSKLKRNEIEFRKALESTVKTSGEENDGSLNFDYDLSFDIKSIAKFKFIFSNVLNQKLSVETRGSLKFASVDGIPRTQGELKLLPGSKLEFFKPFDATGSIRFESDIADPFLDIVATYIGEIEKENSTEEVAVKLKIKSALSKLKENLSNDPSIFSIYVGRENIANETPDPQYDASNALQFILFGQLSLDKNLTASEKSKLAALGESAAYALLGSTLSSFVHSAVGDVISNIQLKKSGEVIFSGRIQNIKYSFGGNTQYFQIDKADIKIEYLFNPNFLIRLEQKDPVVETATEEKVRELGIKYRFRF